MNKGKYKVVNKGVDEFDLNSTLGEQGQIQGSEQVPLIILGTVVNNYKSPMQKRLFQPCIPCPLNGLWLYSDNKACKPYIIWTWVNKDKYIWVNKNG